MTGLIVPFHVIMSSKFHREDKPVIYKEGQYWRVRDNFNHIKSAQMGDVRSAWIDYRQRFFGIKKDIPV